MAHAVPSLPSPPTSPTPKRWPEHPASRPKAVFALQPAAADLIYAPAERAELARLVDLAPAILTPENWSLHGELLADVEIILSGWGAPVMDAAFLAAAPKLKAVFYGAGSVRYFTTEAFWQRPITLSSAFAANAVPVAEYTFATILLSLKQFWSRAAAARRGRGWGDHTRPMSGAFRSNVGLVSFGMIARRTAALLARHDVELLAYCPFATLGRDVRHHVTFVPLPELFDRADVVSIHTPLLPETVGLINGHLLSRLKPDATLINTARGPIINQPELIQTLHSRPDLTAILDVTDPEPPAADDPLFSLPNLIVTPHIAGSHGPECQRMGRYMVDELVRYLAHEPLHWQITREQSLTLA